MINIYTIKIDNNLNKDVFNKLMNSVPEEKRFRISKFRQYVDAQRSLFGDLLIRHGVNNIYDLDYKANFTISNYGKPYISEYPNIHFNVSHSGDWVVCAISTSVVGIDVEEMKSVDLNIAKRFFANEEYQALINTEGNKQQEYFFKIWTLKESYIKAVGKGLSIPLDSFTMSFNDSTIEFRSNIDSNKYSFEQFLIDQKHMVAICSKGNFYGYKMHTHSLNDLVQSVS